MPTPGSPPTSTSEAGTSPPPRTRSSSATPVGIRSASSTSTSTSRSTGRGAAPFAPRGGGWRLLDQRSEAAAAGAAAEPATGRLTAFRAGVLESGLGHGAPTLGRETDVPCADFVTSHGRNHNNVAARIHFVKWMLSIAIAGLVAASALSWTAAAAGPSEARILYRTVRLSAPRKPPELYSILPSGQGRRLLVRGGEQAAWSPGRARIAFSRGIVGKSGIWVMNADGSRARRLTTNPGDGEPTWSPDGRRIVFRRSSATNFDLWIVPAAGGRATAAPANADRERARP